MARFAVLLVMLAALVPWQSASAQDCQAIADPELRADCAIREARRALMLQTCEIADNQLTRAQCMRAEVLQFGIDNVCASGALSTDKVACLERKVEILTRDLADLRRELPRLIEQGVREALEPRVHR